MRPFFIAAALIVCIAVSACGKRPNVLEVPDGQATSNGYPAIEPVPGAPKNIQNN